MKKLSRSSFSSLHFTRYFSYFDGKTLLHSSHKIIDTYLWDNIQVEDLSIKIRPNSCTNKRNGEKNKSVCIKFTSKAL